MSGSSAYGVTARTVARSSQLKASCLGSPSLVRQFVPIEV